MDKKDVILAVLDIISPSPNKPSTFTSDEAHWIAACNRSITYEEWADKVIDKAIAELKELVDSGDIELSDPEVLDDSDTLAEYKEIIKDDTSNILHDAFSEAKEHNSFVDYDTSYSDDETDQVDDFIQDDDE